MSTKTKRPEPAKVRATVQAFTHSETVLVRQAALHFANALEAVDAMNGDPSCMDGAITLRRLAEQLYAANAGRDFIEGAES